MASITIESLQTQIDALNERLNLNVEKLRRGQVDNETSINQIKTKLTVLDGEDNSLHQELHDIGVLVEGIDEKENDVEFANNIHGQEIDRLDSELGDLREEVNDMDAEHHEELHKLAQKIDDHAVDLDKIYQAQEKIPEHVVLSEEEYNKLITPDPFKFYFTYED